MEVSEKILDRLAMKIAGSTERMDTASIQVDDGYVEAEYRKGAVTSTDETGYTAVSCAWCNIYKIVFYDEFDEIHNVKCDIERLENSVASYMNN